MYDPFTLKNKIILVTGASSGIGRAISIACSRMGAVLYLVGRNESNLLETISCLEGVGHQYILADLSKANSCDQVVSLLPQLDGIVYNAGIANRVPCKQIVLNDIDEVFDVNIKSPMLLQAKILSQKKIRKNASIVFIASKAADYPSVGNGIYSASKGALISYSKVLALELSSRNIRVNCICPAMIWTDLILQDGVSKEELESAQLKYPLKRYGVPNDIAYLSVYLLSDTSSWMTGSCIDMTGGAKEL